MVNLCPIHGEMNMWSIHWNEQILGYQSSFLIHNIIGLELHAGVMQVNDTGKQVN